MTAYMPTALETPIVNPAAGTQGPPPIPYISNSVFNFAPTALDGKNLVPGGAGTPGANEQGLADIIRRASRWADTHCFGVDPSGVGPTLAASLSVEDMQTKIKPGGLRLMCSYRPIQQVIGVDVGLSPAQVTSIGAALAAATRIGRKTIFVPLTSLGGRGGSGQPFTGPAGPGGIYAVWSYVWGFPHTKLVSNVAKDATTCTVAATDGNGGLWGVPVAPYLTVLDKQNTETVKVLSVTPAGANSTLTTTPFATAHTIPDAPDFLPMTGIGDDVQQAVIAIASMLIKARGSRALTMPTSPGASPSRRALAQAGAIGDWESAMNLLRPYVIHNKSKV